MSLTGSQIPSGTITTQDDDIFLEGGPRIYFNDRRGSYRWNPDGDNFYWNLSGTSTYPVFEVGCYENFHFLDNVDINDIRCDRLGVVSTIQKRNYMEVTFDLKSFFPLTVLRHMLKGGAVTTNVTDEAEKFGFGPINNQQYYRVYFPFVYNEAEADFVSVTLHRAMFVDAWDWNWMYGDSHSVPITIRGYADSDMPPAQQFATVIRVDASAIP